ncbi:MAG: cyclic nucleotide-binding domain-containing protein [Deltaproteobacteria bacterium]|nr:cyclic nucleotide-binding domain-containing protein [Deltaproteobacteria bacterium]
MGNITITTFNSILEGIDFFKGFSPEEMDILLQVGKWSKVPISEKIIQQGEQDLNMFLLVQGQVEVIYNEKVLATISAGEIFGEVGLMGRPRIAHVESRSECLLLVFNAEDLNKQLPLELQVKFLRRVLDTVFTRLQKSNVQKWLRTSGKGKKEKTIKTRTHIGNR